MIVSKKNIQYGAKTAVSLRIAFCVSLGFCTLVKPQITIAQSQTNVASETLALPTEIEKPNQPDLAFGAFQRGRYLTAFELALPRANLGDPAAQTLIAEVF